MPEPDGARGIQIRFAQGHDFELSDDMTEDKVAVVARKTGALLAGNAKSGLIAGPRIRERNSQKS
jgi:hypothetical protein